MKLSRRRSTRGQYFFTKRNIFFSLYSVPEAKNIRKRTLWFLLRQPFQFIFSSSMRNRGKISSLMLLSVTQGKKQFPPILFWRQNIESSLLFLITASFSIFRLQRARGKCFWSMDYWKFNVTHTRTHTPVQGRTKWQVEFNSLFKHIKIWYTHTQQWFKEWLVAERCRAIPWIKAATPKNTSTT